MGKNAFVIRLDLGDHPNDPRGIVQGHLAGAARGGHLR
jgi:hypothetical protein